MQKRLQKWKFVESTSNYKFMKRFWRKRESLSPLSVLYITIYKRSGKREKVVNFINRIDKIN